MAFAGPPNWRQELGAMRAETSSQIASKHHCRASRHWAVRWLTYEQSGEATPKRALTVRNNLARNIRVQPCTIRLMSVLVCADGHLLRWRAAAFLVEHVLAAGFGERLVSWGGFLATAVGVWWCRR
jgi:hypothetical protein